MSELQNRRRFFKFLAVTTLTPTVIVGSSSYNKSVKKLFEEWTVELNTPTGKMAKSIIEGRVKLGISSRGFDKDITLMFESDGF